MIIIIIIIIIKRSLVKVSEPIFFRNDHCMLIISDVDWNNSFWINWFRSIDVILNVIASLTLTVHIEVHFDGTLPSYLSASFCTYQTSCTLWSLNEQLLKIPKCSLKSVGDRCFSFIAPTVWNLLPASLRNLPTLSDFKAQLKIFLFQQAFTQI